MMNKPHSASEVDDGISHVNLKSFILFGKLWTVPLEHIFECMLLSVDLGSVYYIFASLFFKSKREHLWTWRNVLYFTSKALFVLLKIKF